MKVQNDEDRSTRFYDNGGAAFLDGRYGRTFATDSAWIATGAATCGNSSYHILCLAWR